MQRKTLPKKAEPSGPEYVLISGCWVYNSSARHASGRFRVKYVRHGKVLRCYATGMTSGEIQIAIMGASNPEFVEA